MSRGAFCLDMHWLDARADGEPEARLYSLDTWNRLMIATRAQPGHYRPGMFA